MPVAENLIDATGADFRIGGARAFYSPSEDFVQVPPQPAFKHQIDFYRTALHELGHWTGHSSRLARSFGARFGNSAYAREELCAELASAYVCAALGIVPTRAPCRLPWFMAFGVARRQPRHFQGGEPS
jgi:antirestriction protein ArdC